MSEAITSKLESIISGHKVNADDADWLRAALSQPTRHLTVTTVESGEAVMVSWQDEDHRILEVVWERKGPSPQPAVPEWLNSAFPNSEDLHALGLTVPTPAQFAQQLHKRWKAKLEKVEEELCALKATNAPQPAVPDDGDFFVLDDEAKAMIVNSHHYTPGNIQALIEQLTAFSDPTKTTQADWDNLDWRGFCNVLQRVMMGLACDLQPAVPVVAAFAEGWRMAADWANRDDLLPDMDSPQYAKERDERLAELRPAVEPMTPFTPSQRMRLWQNTEKGKSATSLGAFERICQTVEAAHRIGITAKAEGGA